MSVAFTREEDLESRAAHLPDRPISQHRNLVTAEGLAAIDAALAAAREAYAAAQTAGDVNVDKMAMAIATRDLRYWTARRRTAELVEATAAPGVVAFGRTVTFEREDVAGSPTGSWARTRPIPPRAPSATSRPPPWR